MIMFAPGSINDPYAFDRSNTLQGFSITQGRLTRRPAASSDQRTGVFICVGQSMIGNSEDAVYSPVYGSAIDNLNIYDGGLYEARVPLLGAYLSPAVTATGGNWLLRWADKLVAGNVFDRVILVPIAIGDTYVAQWAPGGAYAERLAVANAWCIYRGFDISAYLWQLGETDRVLGTSQSVYQDLLGQIISGVRATGHAAPWLIAKSTYGGGATSAAVRAAQAAIVNGTDILPGPDTDTLGLSYRQADTVHWNASGSDACASLWRDAYLATL